MHIAGSCKRELVVRVALRYQVEYNLCWHIREGSVVESRGVADYSYWPGQPLRYVIKRYTLNVTM
jgi:hypothetical protein